MENFVNIFENIIDSIFLGMLNNAYSIPTLVAMLTIVCKLLINNQVCALDIKRCIVELPCEISILTLGFDVSYFSICGIKYVDTAVRLLFISLLVLIFNCAIAKYLFNKLARITFSRGVLIFVEYIFSIFIYFAAIYVMINMREMGNT